MADDYEIGFHSSYGQPSSVYLHFRTLPNTKAKFAMAMVERLALIAAEGDGEDSAGRQKLRRLDAKEIANIACDISDSLFDEFATREWLITIPPLEEVRERAREERDRN